MRKGLLSTILIALLSLSAYSDDIKLKFRILDEGNNVMKGMTVRLYDRNEVIKEIEKAGTIVEFDLKEASIYTIELELRGFVTKRMTVVKDLLTDSDQLEKDTYKFKINIERAVDYEDFEDAEDVSDYPGAVITCDTNSGVFKYNEAYLLSTEKAFTKMIDSGRDIKF
jgi:hypothetical protein